MLIGQLPLHQIHVIFISALFANKPNENEAESDDAIKMLLFRSLMSDTSGYWRFRWAMQSSLC